MKYNKVKILIIFMITVIFSGSCEKEKTEYHQKWDNPDFYGFTYGLFTIHDNSIGYYDPDSNKVFPDIYQYQNGSAIGDGIHSFQAGLGTGLEFGLISVEKENKVIFVNLVNFLYTNTIAINQPRDIFDMGQYCLISFSNKASGGVAILDLVHQQFIKGVKTNNEAGKIFMDNNYFYVFCSGKNKKDSVIAVLYSPDLTQPDAIHTIDTIPIGIRPVDYVEIKLNYNSQQHKGLAILCMGNETIPASVVLFDLATRTIVETFFFADPGLKPESMFWFDWPNSENKILAVYANNKLYQTMLSDQMNTTILINKNVSNLYEEYGMFYIGVSRDTINDISYLYKFSNPSLALLDSIQIEGRAKKMEGLGI